MVLLCTIIYREGMSDVSLPGNLPDNGSSLSQNEGVRSGMPPARSGRQWLSLSMGSWDNSGWREPLEGSGPTCRSKQVYFKVKSGCSGLCPAHL